MIRSADYRDLERLEQLWFHTVVNGHSLPRQYWQARRPDFRRDCLGAETCLVYVENINDTADGFIVVAPGDALLWLCVNPVKTRQGVGSQLMAAAQHGRDQLHTWLLQDNLEARVFLQDRGFVERERRPGPVQSQYWLCMQFRKVDGKNKPKAA